MDDFRLEGPRLNTLSGNTRQLIVILHGYGADGADLMPLAHEWQKLLPDAEFVAPDAPWPCDNNPLGCQWFPLNITPHGVVSTPMERWQGAQGVAPALHDFIDSERERTGLKESQVALAGFSQGAMMALHAGLHRRETPAAVVSYSGMILGPQYLDGISARPPVFMAHGSADDIVPFEALSMSQQALQKAGISVETWVEQGVGHGIDDRAVELGGRFLAKNFGVVSS